MAKHTVKMDGKLLSPQKDLATLLNRQFSQIVTEANINSERIFIEGANLEVIINEKSS